VTFDLDNAPARERKAEPPKKKEKKPVAEVVKERISEVKGAVKEKVDAISEKAAPKKEKKEKADKNPAGGANGEGGKKGESPPKQAAADDVGEPQPSMIDLRVGKIVEIAKHPDADSLYVEVSLDTLCRRMLIERRVTSESTLARKRVHGLSSPVS
jgi:aminoacyl tRNA synthase complex-interacting multifunctional protein 1